MPIAPPPPGSALSSGSRSSAGSVGGVDAAVVAAILARPLRRVRPEHVDLHEELAERVLEVELGQRAGGVAAEPVEHLLELLRRVPFLELRLGLTRLFVPPRSQHQHRESEHPLRAFGRGLLARLPGRDLQLAQGLRAHVETFGVEPDVARASDALRQARRGFVVPGSRGRLRERRAVWPDAYTHHPSARLVTVKPSSSRLPPVSAFVSCALNVEPSGWRTTMSPGNAGRGHPTPPVRRPWTLRPAPALLLAALRTVLPEPRPARAAPRAA